MRVPGKFVAWQRLMFPAGEGAGSPGDRRKGAIVLYCDLKVDPKREQEMLDHYHRTFKPTAEKFDGFIDLKMLKLRKVLQGGPAPEDGINYRFQLTYESEEKRQIWIASELHRRVWPLIENTLTDMGYIVLLTDAV